MYNTHVFIFCQKKQELRWNDLLKRVCDHGNTVYKAQKGIFWYEQVDIPKKITFKYSSAQPELS